MEAELRSDIIQWARPFENTIMYNVAYQAMDLLDALDAKTASVSQIRVDFDHLVRVEPLRERVVMEAERVSHVGGAVREYELAKMDFEQYGPTMNAKTLLLMKKQVADLKQRAEKSPARPMNLVEFEELKAFIGQLSVHGVDVLTVQDRFESWQRAYREKKKNNGISLYEKSFDKGYNDARRRL